MGIIPTHLKLHWLSSPLIEIKSEILIYKKALRICLVISLSLTFHVISFSLCLVSLMSPLLDLADLSLFSCSVTLFCCIVPNILWFYCAVLRLPVWSQHVMTHSCYLQTDAAHAGIINAIKSLCQLGSGNEFFPHCGFFVDITVPSNHILNQLNCSF